MTRVEQLALAAALPIGILLGLGVPIVHAYIRINRLPLPYSMDSYGLQLPRAHSADHRRPRPPAWMLGVA